MNRRSKARAAVVELLTQAELPADDSLKNAPAESELPRIHVRIVEETVEEEDRTMAGQYTPIATMNITAILDGGASADDLDDLLEQVDAALGEDVSLDGVADDVQFAGYSLDLDDEAAIVAGTSAYLIRYR